MTPDPGRILGLDLGDVRVGLALSDPLGITAQPAGTLDRKGGPPLVERIRSLVAEHGVTRIVVGRPLLLSGAVGERAAESEAVARQLRAVLPDVEVELWDERLTTAEAERVMIAADVSRKKRRSKIDTLAAVLILQSYMDARGAPLRGES
ncbi:MAG: Holliday junction resolvase RuvX [Acidobacteriota bacterium]|nr:Holliday junction resolvase RuvX [Acidobacteriota bacterium]